MRKNYINGDWVDALSNQTKLLINPASEEKIADLPGYFSGYPILG